MNTQKITSIITIVLLCAVIVGGAYMFMNEQKVLVKGDEGEYFAFFLTTGQVYFGQLADANDTYQKIINVHYLQAPVLEEGISLEDVTLIRLGNELHQPEDEIYLSKRQILLVQKLSDESRVLEAIKESSAN